MKSPYYTKTQVDSKVDDLEVQISNVSDGTSGKAYPDLTTAMAVVPLPDNGIIFTIDETNDIEKGVYAYDSTEINGYRFVREIGADGKIEENDSRAVNGNEIFEKSLDLFKVENTNLFSDANLTVRRYGTTGAITNYTAGYSQTPTDDGLQVSIPASGSTAIKHYIRTGLISPSYFTVNIEVASTPTNTTVGIGFENEDENYVAYVLYANGQFVKMLNNTTTVLTATVTYSAEDIIGFTIRDRVLTITKNEEIVVTQLLEDGEFTTELFIAQGGFPTFIFSMNTETDPIRDYVKSEAANNNSLPNCFYYYDPLALTSVTNPTNTGMFTVFVKLQGNKYAGFHLGHEVDMRELIYKDYWRIRNASLYLYQNEIMVDTGNLVLASGESECVWKRNSNKDDFTGGTHGDELVVSIDFYVNGVRLDNSLLNEVIPLTPCDNFYYVEKSTMHETAENEIPIPGHPLECYHTKKTVFDKKGYTTFNRLEWASTGLITLWYFGIVCFAKDFGSEFYTEDFNIIESGGLPETLAYKDVWYNNVEKNKSGFVSSSLLKIIQDGTDITNEKEGLIRLFISDRIDDNKYYRRLDPTTVYTGDIWESITTVNFDLI